MSTGNEKIKYDHFRDGPQSEMSLQFFKGWLKLLEGMRDKNELLTPNTIANMIHRHMDDRDPKPTSVTGQITFSSGELGPLSGYMHALYGDELGQAKYAEIEAMVQTYFEGDADSSICLIPACDPEQTPQEGGLDIIFCCYVVPVFPTHMPLSRRVSLVQKAFQAARDAETIEDDFVEDDSPISQELNTFDLPKARLN